MAIVTLDDFEVEQTSATESAPAAPITDESIVGDERELSVLDVETSDTVNEGDFSVIDGVLDFTTGSDTTKTGIVTYDAVGDGDLGLDLGGNLFVEFLFDVVSIGGTGSGPDEVTVSIRLVDGDGTDDVVDVAVATTGTDFAVQASDFTSDMDFSDIASISLEVGSETEGTDITIDDFEAVVDQNVAPLLDTADGTDPEFVEGDPAVALFENADVDAATLEAGQLVTALTLTVENVGDGADEILNIDGSDIALTDGTSVNTTNGTVDVSVANGTATVSFTASPGLTESETEALIDGITYENTSEDPTEDAGGPPDRVVTITEIVDDGGTVAGGVDTSVTSFTSNIDLTPLNDAPVVSNVFDETSAIGIGAGAIKVPGFDDAMITDPDAADFDGGSLVISQNTGTTNGSWDVDGVNATVATAGGAIVISVGGTVIGAVGGGNDGDSGSDLQIDFNSNATPARIQTLLQALTYDAPSDAGQREFTLTLTDGDGTPNGGDNSTSGTFTINVNTAPTGEVTIDGTLEEGRTLTVDTSAVEDADGPDPIVPDSYQWQRDGTPIADATEPTYTLTADDVGAEITVVVGYTDGFGTPESVTSVATDPIGDVDDVLTGDEGDNILSGGAGNDVLTGGPGNDTLEGGDGADTFIITPGGWNTTILDFELGVDTLVLDLFAREEALAAFFDATSGSAILTFGDGTEVDVQGPGVTPETLTIDDVVFGGGNLAPTGDVIVTGDPIIGETLTADVSGVSDPEQIDQTTTELQWQRSGVDIPGATGPSYQLTQADVGSTITAIYSYTDTFGTDESVTSTPTARVLPEGETITGTPDPDVLQGTDGSDTIEALGSDDVIIGGPGNDEIDGGPGTDTAVFSGNQSSYTLELTSGSTTIVDRRKDGTGTDDLVDMELLDFAGSAPNFDLVKFAGSAGLGVEQFENIIELYIASFDRAPDAIGLNFWATAFANGTTLEEAAALFMDQDETRALYPEGTTNEAFITAVYDNVLGRDPDDLGFDFWVGKVNSGEVTRDGFILELLQGAKADPPADATQEFIDQQLADQQFLANKVDIGTYFAVTKGMSDVENGSDVMELFDGTPASIDAAVAATDAFHSAALDANTGEFLMPLVGVLDDPFAIV